MSLARQVASQVASSVARQVVRSAGGGRVPMPDAITEYWIAGEGLLKSGDVPASDGDIVTKWVGRKLGTVLTASSSLVAKDIGGLLTPVAVTDAAVWTLPVDFSLGNSRDISAYCHVGAAGMNGEGSFFGLGSSRMFELLHFQRIDPISYDGVTLLYNAITGFISPCTIGVRSAASNLKPFSNANEVTKAAWRSNTITGGCFGGLHNGTVPLVARWYGIAVGPLLDDETHTGVLDYFQSIKPSPSDTVPTLNIAAYGDSQTEGTNSGGQSWAHLFADNDNARVLHVGNSAGYFGVGGNPANKAVNNAQLAIEYKAGAGKNVAVVAFTNDLDQGTGAGAAHMARVKTWGQARQGEGWEVAVCKLPDRISPYSSAATYNPEVAAFNGLCDSDPWMDYVPDLAAAINGVSGALNADGIHWSAAGQQLVYDAIAASIT